MATAELLESPPSTMPRGMTAEEYLAWEADPERAGDRKSEFVAGEVFTKRGVSITHERIAGNVRRLLKHALDPSQWFISSGDLKVGLTSHDYIYPDVAVALEPPESVPGRDDVLCNPVVAFEVLSPTTAGRDRGLKAVRYRRTPTLRDYVLLSQYEPCVEHFARGDRWEVSDLADAATLKLTGVDVELPLTEINRGVSFSDASRAG